MTPSLTGHCDVPVPDDNGLAVCVRSHEVPNTLRGFEVQHDNRMITVFSASNYCGSTGNFGAVLRYGPSLLTAPPFMPPSTPLALCFIPHAAESFKLGHEACRHLGGISMQKDLFTDIRISIPMCIPIPDIPVDHSHSRFHLHKH